MSPDDLSSKGFDTQIHVTVNSRIFGFIDDMYMQVQQYSVGGSSDINTIVLEVQSQLRMGSSDFMQNYNHIKIILDCLDKHYDNYDKTPLPCSE